MIDLESIGSAICIVFENDAAENTVVSSLQAAAVTALSTFLGAVLLGPFGIVAGASAGSLGMYCVKKSSFKSILHVIQNDLSTSQKRQLQEHVQRAINNFGVEDVVMLMALARENSAFKEVVVRTVTTYLNNNRLLESR